ncbi:MAG: dTMP kinase [Thermodesulfobacteriota bacterium]|nr:dTMP kinase [Thermodesulfobacteriota bacterium]
MFISFEGIEGCGKSTQANRLIDRLRKLGVTVIGTLEPGGTRVGQDIRRIVLASRNQDLSPLAELLLYAADRAQHVKEVVEPQLRQGNWVVCDRFFDATMAYQGYGRGQDLTLINALNREVCSGIRPDMTFLIDCPVEVGLERALRRNRVLLQEAQDRFEREERGFHEAVRKGYISMAEEDRERFLVVDGTLEEYELEEMIFEYVRPFVSEKSVELQP